MTHLTHLHRAAAGLSLTASLQACVVHHPATVDQSLKPGTELRIRSTSPLKLTRQIDTAASPLCCLTSIEGSLVRVSADTVFFARRTELILSNRTRIRTSPETLKAVITAGTEVTVRRVDPARTTILLVGIAAVIIGLAALAASQIQYDGLLTPDN